MRVSGNPDSEIFKYVPFLCVDSLCSSPKTHPFLLATGNHHPHPPRRGGASYFNNGMKLCQNQYAGGRDVRIPLPQTLRHSLPAVDKGTNCPTCFIPTNSLNSYCYQSQGRPFLLFFWGGGEACFFFFSFSLLFIIIHQNLT